MKTNISKINIQLLIAFATLLKVRHVTNAARELNLSQSALSNILKQLRYLFQDQLFVRGQASCMLPTPRALELAADVNTAVQHFQLLFQKQNTFAPKTAIKTFTLGLSDYTELVMLPVLIQYLEKNAPGITLNVRHVNFLTDCKMFENDCVDLTVGSYNAIPKELIARPVYIDRSVCIGWNKNPLLQKPLSGEEFAKAKHLIILYYADRSLLYSEKFIESLGIKRQVVATVPHTLPAIFSLPHTQYISIVYERAAKKLTKQLPLKMQPVIFKQCTRCEIEMVWHPKNRNDPAHTWLRDLIIQLAKKY